MPGVIDLQHGHPQHGGLPMSDVSAIAAQAVAAAEEKAAAAPTSDHYAELYGPVECAGGHGTAHLVRNKNTGVTYAEHRPSGGGRVKRVPLSAVAALFPQILPSDSGESQPAPKGKGSK